MQRDKVTSQDIEALVDGQLDPASAQRLQQLIHRQPRLQRHYQRLVAQKSLLQRWWQHDRAHNRHH